MQLLLDVKISKNYKSKSQIARILSEDWVLNNSYCPSCGRFDLNNYKQNNPAADFYCRNCRSDYELKSFRKFPKQKIVDGAYDSMINKILKNKNPNFLFLQYDSSFSVLNYFTIPNYFFSSEIIEKRRPLSETARRANWIGCNILFGNLPKSGMIYLIKDSTIINPSLVVDQWQKTSFLTHRKIENRGWLIELIRIVENISANTFTLKDVYKFEGYLKQKFPKNKYIKEKIRQQLQVLRDKGIIKFLGYGNYQKGD